MWLAKLDAQVAEGARAATTADTYRQRLSVILPATSLRSRADTLPMIRNVIALVRSYAR
jgi:hypothetical protein